MNFTLAMRLGTLVLKGLYYYTLGDHKNEHRVLYQGVKCNIHGSRGLLGHFYLRAGGHEKRAVYWFLEGAKQGETYAIKHLAKMFHSGVGDVKANGKKAIICYEKLAECGNSDAMVKIGDIYYLGWKGVKEDMLKAEEWYKRALPFNNKEAYTRLGSMYCDEESGEQMGTWEEGIRLLTKAAEYGVHHACLELGKIYHYGNKKGEMIDYKKAVYYYKKSSQEDEEVLYELGNMYRYGAGEIKQDINKAIQYYERAAEKEEDEAMIQLGKIYHFEDGYRNYARACHWYKKALEYTHDDAEMYLDSLKAACHEQRAFFGGNMDEYLGMIMKLR